MMPRTRVYNRRVHALKVEGTFKEAHVINADLKKLHISGNIVIRLKC